MSAVPFDEEFTHQAAPVFVALPEGNVLVVLPPILRHWLSVIARRVDEVTTLDQGPLGTSLFGPVNLERDVDDVVVLLQRQMAVESAAARVIARAQATEISPDEALDWLRVIQLGLRVATTPLGLATATELDVPVEVLAGLLSLLSYELCEALDPTPDDAPAGD